MKSSLQLVYDKFLLLLKKSKTDVSTFGITCKSPNSAAAVAFYCLTLFYSFQRFDKPSGAHFFTPPLCLQQSCLSKSLVDLLIPSRAALRTEVTLGRWKTNVIDKAVAAVMKQKLNLHHVKTWIAQFDKVDTERQPNVKRKRCEKLTSSQKSLSTSKQPLQQRKCSPLPLLSLTSKPLPSDSCAVQNGDKLRKLSCGLLVTEEAIASPSEMELLDNTIKELDFYVHTVRNFDAFDIRVRNLTTTVLLQQPFEEYGDLPE